MGGLVSFLQWVWSGIGSLGGFVGLLGGGCGVFALFQTGKSNLLAKKANRIAQEANRIAADAKFKKMADTLMSIVREGKHHGLAFTLPEDGRDVCCIWTPGVPISFKEADSESE